MVIKTLRRKSHTVQLDKPGYATLEIAVVRHTSGWIWGNIVIGGLVGLVVDLCTGASNNLVPDNVRAELVTIDAESGE